MLKALPFDQWPTTDRSAWEAAFVEGDIFDQTQGPGAHLSLGSRRFIKCAYRRWLGYLANRKPDLLEQPPTARISSDVLRDYVVELESKCASTTTAVDIHGLYLAARLLAPQTDWTWLRSLRSALTARARPQDRFDRLTPAWHTLDLGLDMMERAASGTWTPAELREYRDGLLLALLSLWQIRRRSLAALSVSRHVIHRGDRVELCLHEEDTKAKRAERYALHDVLAPYFERYLLEVRPRIPGALDHDGLWASFRGRPLSGEQLYQIVRFRTKAAFGKAMGLHDLRRAAATYLAIEAPELVGLIPGILQQASPDVGERHYNLARSTAASRRFATHVTDLRKRLRPASRKPGGTDRCVP